MTWEKRILHLGLGRFHRGHQAVYYQRMAELGDHRWGAVSMSMRSPDTRDQMRSVKNHYPVLELSEKEAKLLVVDSIREALDAKDNLEEVLSYFVSPDIEIVSLTVTEKGYCLKSSGELDLDHPGITHDLLNFDHPETAIGLLALGLSKRMNESGRKVTILSCDNLRENGHKLENALKTYLKSAHKDSVREWIDVNATFPCSMVDRIVPSLTLERIEKFESEYKLHPKSQLIATETFSQWVIEDLFAVTRPPWERVGVEFVKDVRPYEDMKLRLLNASHSYLAYAGSLKGYKFVHEAVMDETLNLDLRSLMLEEVAPLLIIPVNFNVENYVESLLERFRNSKLPHQLLQIAMDGSQKIPQRVLPSLLNAYEKNSSRKVLLKAISAWLNFVWRDLNLKLDDPMINEFRAISKDDKTTWMMKMLETSPFTSLNAVPVLKDEIVRLSIL